MKKYLLILLPCLLAITAWSQERIITGKVTGAEDGLSIPGVNVVVEGTSKGTTTDAEGNYSIQLTPSENTLIFTFVGFKPITVDATARTTVDVVLESDVTSLQEVVVVGYGVQREKDLTSAITTVKADEIAKTPSGQAMQALQGKVPGLQVVSKGTPGDQPTIRIRGIGSFPGVGSSNENPLYVVDGMFFDNIDFLSPSDIETISILKDASAAAIYGVRAANGVVLITTKGGSFNQEAQITYDGYYGTQIAQNVLKMANAEQFTTMANESGSAPDAGFILNAMQRYGRSRVNPNVPDVNQDWYKEVLRPAPIQNHSIGVSGGGENTTYSIGANYFAQDGILDMENDYKRFNLRMKLDYHANDWLTIGGSLNMSNALKNSPEQSIWNQAYFAVPIMPAYDPQNTEATPIMFADATDLQYRSGQNPLVPMTFNKNRLKIRKLLANFYVKLDLIKDKLSFQTTYNNGSTYLFERVMELPYFIGTNFNRDVATLTKKNESYVNQIWDNVLTYNQAFGSHYVTVMAGASFRDELFEMLTARGSDFPDIGEYAWYLRQAENISIDAVDDDGRRLYGMSYFGRIAYNFNDKYLLYGTFRADGSSKYQEKWGYFPSVGAGWVISEENFLQGNSVVDFLKLRASWGVLGNDKINPSSGSNTTSLITSAFDDILVTGTVTTNTFNYLTWESTEELNIGISSRVFGSRLSVETDYFVRDTKDAAIWVTAPITGVTNLKSVGVIRNSGFELALNWSDVLPSGVSYNIGTNIATLKNEVRDLYGQQYIDGGQAEFRQRSIVGEPLLAFFGYEVEGVYQNQTQVEADPVAVALNAASANSIVPGDFRYKDQNGDGLIDGDDRVVLGSYFPTFTYGANLGAAYKGFSLSVNLMGQSGNKIVNRKRGEIIWTADGNMDANLATGRWHGEGTSNEYPSSAGLRKGWNQKMSTYFVEDGDFFRIQNVQLAYTLKSKEVFGSKMPEARISLTADRPLTIFDYNGFNPEVDNGIDMQTYPIPAVYTVGLNLKF
ncbi:MAG: TonB-dependent receptor [Cyclobacteriaceae bacterium]